MPAFSQTPPDTVAQPPVVAPDTTRLPDILPQPDSTTVAAAQGDTMFVQPKGMIDRPAFSSARDSVMEDIENHVIYYFGDVTAKYQDMPTTWPTIPS